MHLKKWLMIALAIGMVMVPQQQTKAAELAVEIKSEVTVDELNEDEVYIKQSRRGTCTLASSAMIMRRAALLLGDENWDEITEHSLASVAWSEYVGISWKFTFHDLTMVHAYVDSVNDLKELLKAHPEGIVAYDTYTPHAIALTDYDEETDTFYCSDPAEHCPEGRYPVSGAMIDVEDVRAVWYIETPQVLRPSEKVRHQVIELPSEHMQVLDKTAFLTETVKEELKR